MALLRNFFRRRRGTPTIETAPAGLLEGPTPAIGGRRAPVIDMPGSNPDAEALAARLEDHLEQQERSTQRLGEVLGQLDRTIAALPELSRNNTHLVEAVHEIMARHREREDRLHGALAQVGESTDKQAHVMAAIRRHLESTEEHTIQLTAALHHLQRAMGTLGASHDRTIEAIHTLATEGTKRDELLTASFRRLERAFMIGGAALAAVSITAIVIALVR